MELRLGHHVIRLEMQGHPFREWSHIQETRVAKLGEKAVCGDHKPHLQRLEDSPVGEGLEY